MKPIILLNPNSSEQVTEGIDAAVDPLRALGVPIQCVTLKDGPPGIETQAQADRVIAPMLDLAAGIEASAFVVACFGDPGLHAMRDEMTVPVLGIQECAVMQALTVGQRFGVIAILERSVPRHYRAFGAMGVLDRLVGDYPLDLTVAELADADRTVARMAEVGQRLRADGANSIIMGCAGMARYRAQLEQDIGLPVIEPCQAAVGMAITRVTLMGGVQNA
ncbi:Asp/Glu/hydantoin racemase [Rubricella aquisinus]|uniref:Asp/Glu/hydantoin racemase n=1 Tax=Rubricella aquisinus TaxID=2028108 RepID=A0A840WXW6_9RHOB|nr:aspartate/glutamate racemase family protein [Rubricella aquisinus]MBB5514516.1 Asp/Glu/hydantoin racemase [Rubricella aquisinus]